MNRFVVLDSFRGLCALAVVLFHTQIVQSFSELAFFRHADLFVEFFFVLSGFVLYHAYGSRTFNGETFRRFLISRTFRIFPLHLVMLGVFILLECGKLWASHHGLTFNDPPFTGKTAPSEILPNAFLLQSWFDAFESLSFNVPAWSISIEYYLYLLLALVLFALPQYAGRLFLLMSLVSFAALFFELELIKPFIWRGASCFFAGVLTYMAFVRIRPWVERLDDRTLFTAAELLALLLVYRTLTTPMPHQGLVASLLFCAVVVLFAFERGAFSALLKGWGFRQLGELSYSIYLTHAAVIFCFTSVAILLSKLTGHSYTVIVPVPGSEQIMRYITTGSWLLDDVVTVIELAAVLAVSWLTYRFVELRGIALGKRLLALRGRGQALPGV